MTVRRPASGLEEDAEVLVEQDVGVEHDRAPGHLPRAVDLAQHVLAATGEELMIRIQASSRGSRSRRFPRIDQGEAAARKIPDIAGCELSAGDTGGRRDLRIEGLDRSAFTTATGDDLSVMDGRRFVER